MPAWAFSSLLVTDGPLLDALSPRALNIITDFDRSHLSISAWSVAQLVSENGPVEVDCPGGQ